MNALRRLFLFALSCALTFVLWCVFVAISIPIAQHYVSHDLAFLIGLLTFIPARMLTKRLLRGMRGGESLTGVSFDRTPGGSAPPDFSYRVPPKPTAPVTYPPGVYGDAGGSIAASTAFGAEDVAAGAEGEVKTGQMLADLQAMCPGSFVFHSLAWPGSNNADIDHIFAYQDNYGTSHVCLIDSKMWKRGNYDFDGYEAFLNGQPYHRIKFSSAVKTYRDHFAASHRGKVVVHGYVVIHNSKSATNSSGQSSETGTVIITPREFYNEMRQRIIETNGLVPQTVIRRIMPTLKR